MVSKKGCNTLQLLKAVNLLLPIRISISRVEWVVTVCWVGRNCRDWCYRCLLKNSVVVTIGHTFFKALGLVGFEAKVTFRSFPIYGNPFISSRAAIALSCAL